MSNSPTLTIPPPYPADELPAHGADVHLPSGGLNAPTLASGDLSNAPQPVRLVPHNYHEPFIDALTLAAELHSLQLRCTSNIKLRVRHMGELLCGVRRLLDRARECGVMSASEQIAEMNPIVSMVEQTFPNAGGTPASRDVRREELWKSTTFLVLNLQDRLARGHVETELNHMRNAIRELHRTAGLTQTELDAMTQ